MQDLQQFLAKKLVPSKAQYLRPWLWLYNHRQEPNNYWNSNSFSFNLSRLRHHNDSTNVARVPSTTLGINLFFLCAGCLSCIVTSLPYWFYKHGQRYLHYGLPLYQSFHPFFSKTGIGLHTKVSVLPSIPFMNGVRASETSGSSFSVIVNPLPYWFYKRGQRFLHALRLVETWVVGLSCIVTSLPY